MKFIIRFILELEKIPAVKIKWSISDIELKEWLFPHLLRLTSDKRKSVAGRAEKMIDKLKG